jgi:uncharacterized protein (DUF1697 family)
MAVLVAMLRGVNVGGRNKLAMDALRTLCGSLGLRQPQTCLQSGNVVFATDQPDLIPLASGIEDAIEKRFGFRPAVILRTPAELTRVIARNPFAARDGIDPARLIVTFLARDPGPGAHARIRALHAGPEELRLAGRELYTYYPDGMGRSKLSPALLDKALATPGTGRNWNTVTKLLELAQRLAAAP